MPSVTHKRGTSSALIALAQNEALIPWQLYATTDEGKLYLATTADSYIELVRSFDLEGTIGRHYVAVAASGTFVSAAVNSNALGTIQCANGRVDYHPFNPSRSITIDQAVIEVTTAVTSTTATVGIYSSDSFGRPSTLLSTSDPLATTSTGSKTWSLVTPLSMKAGVQYWIAVVSNGNPTLRGIGGGSLIPVDVPTAGAAASTVRRATGQSGIILASTSPSTTPALAAAPQVRLRIS